ncbi:carbonic anhydrase 3 [Limosa lapponica baueri]|uniref:carbonic anhydrase n=1 Tax=Limosa lapponica baueri TaxID=1758121 RepID=A0A2I0T4R8_LIMLA|nr:carbonic anhydrase 3 [Limosa lapponica baueri]
MGRTEFLSNTVEYDVKIQYLCFALQVGKTPKPEMKRILEEIDNIKTKGKEAPFQHFDPSILFPKSRDYWTYHGSFTTPPCEECITWILLREPIEVSADQNKIGTSAGQIFLSDYLAKS